MATATYCYYDDNTAYDYDSDCEYDCDYDDETL